MKYSERCHYVIESEQGTHRSPCSLPRNHEGRHRDGYGHYRDPEKYWYDRPDHEQMFEELSERVKEAGMEMLLQDL